MSKTIFGIGREYDVSMIAGPQMRTTTSQYKCVGIPNTTTAAKFTAYMTNNLVTANEDTATAYMVVGINQTYLSANAAECSVRMFGLSKALCAASIQIGSPVAAYYGISTTTYPGAIQQIAGSVSVYGATAGGLYFRVLGFAMENGSTNSVITIMVNPTFAHRQTVME